MDVQAISKPCIDNSNDSEPYIAVPSAWASDSVSDELSCHSGCNLHRSKQQPTDPRHRLRLKGAEDHYKELRRWQKRLQMTLKP